MALLMVWLMYSLNLVFRNCVEAMRPKFGQLAVTWQNGITTSTKTASYSCRTFKSLCNHLTDCALVATSLFFW